MRSRPAPRVRPASRTARSSVARTGSTAGRAKHRRWAGRCSPIASSSAAGRAASRWARGSSASACRPSSWKRMRAPATRGAIGTSRSCCTTRSGTTTCLTCRSRTTGRCSRPRIRWAIGWSFMPGSWSSITGLRPNASTPATIPCSASGRCWSSADASSWCCVQSSWCSRPAHTARRTSSICPAPDASPACNITQAGTSAALRSPARNASSSAPTRRRTTCAPISGSTTPT